MTQRISAITISVGKYDAVAYIHRGNHCKMHSAVTQSSLRRVQRAQVKLMENVTQ